MIVAWVSCLALVAAVADDADTVESPVDATPVATEPTAAEDAIAVDAAPTNDASDVVFADAPRRRSNEHENGVIVSAGLGAGFNGFGINVGYNVHVGASSFHLIPYAGYGWLGSEEAGRDTVHSHGPVAGVTTTFGSRHRAMLDVSYGIVAVERFTLYGAQAGVRTMWGLSAVAGYAFATQNGVLLRIGLGPAIHVAPYSPEGSRVSLNGTLAAGYTF